MFLAKIKQLHEDNHYHDADVDDDDHHHDDVCALYLWYVFVFVNQFGKFFYSFAQITHSNTHNNNNNNNNLLRYSGKTVAETMEVLISIK